jgi:DUF971 family protein
MANSLPFSPTKIKAPHGARIFEITWSDGKTHRIEHRVLRGYCPCATCQGHHGVTHFVSGGNLDLREITRVGNYALGLTWGDGHNGGIFSFEYLRRLGNLIEELGVETLCGLEQLPP